MKAILCAAAEQLGPLSITVLLTSACGGLVIGIVAIFKLLMNTLTTLTTKMGAIIERNTEAFSKYTLREEETRRELHVLIESVRASSDRAAESHQATMEAFRNALDTVIKIRLNKPSNRKA